MNCKWVQVKLDPELTQGFSGLVSPPQGEVCPAVVPAPFKLGEDITSNSVCCACLRMPEPEQEHRTILLPGTVLDVSALPPSLPPFINARDRPKTGLVKSPFGKGGMFHEHCPTTAPSSCPALHISAADTSLQGKLFLWELQSQP